MATSLRIGPRSVAAAHAPSAEPAPGTPEIFAFLPADVVASIFLLVPVPDRLRCREVCRSWRAFPAQPHLWRVLDLSANSGCALRPPFHWDVKLLELIQAASAAAHGGVEMLDFLFFESIPINFPSILEVVRQNGQSLRAIRLVKIEDGLLCSATASRVFEWAPSLVELAVDCSASKRYLDGLPDDDEIPTVTVDDLQEWTGLLTGPRRSVIRVESMEIQFDIYERPYLSGELSSALREMGRALGRAFTAGTSTTSGQPGLHRLESLRFCDVYAGAEAADAHYPAAAVVDACISSRPRELHFINTEFFGFLPHLTRILTECPGLELLSIEAYVSGDIDEWMLPAVLEGASDADFGALCDALRSSRIARLVVKSVALWDLPAPALAAVFGALQGHPTLCDIDLAFNKRSHDEEHMAAPIAGLIAANSPALRTLDVTSPGKTDLLGQEGLIRVFEALRSNSHLESLAFGGGWVVNHESAVLREHGLAAVRACGSLKQLLRFDRTTHKRVNVEDDPGMEELKALLEARRGGGAGRR